MNYSFHRLLYKDNFAQFWFQVCLLSSQIPYLLTLYTDNPTGLSDNPRKYFALNTKIFQMTRLDVSPR